MNLNKVILIGRLTQDPEVRMTASGTPVANVRMATNRYYSGKDGQRQEQTEFHSVVLWGRQAEIARDYLKQGQLAMVEGRLQTRSWEKDGQKRYMTEVVAENVQLGPKAGSGGAGGDAGPAKPAAGAAKSSAPAKTEDADIPVIDEDTVMDFGDDEQKQVDPKDIPF
jgi:single-strand DNA-binding protein